MVSRPYNGFPAAYRSKRGGEVYKMFKTGQLKRPESCIMCQRTADSGATIHAHAEDYHLQTDYVGLCFMCHMAVHKRFSNLKTWYAWREATLSGWQPPKNRDYRVFAQVWDTLKQEPIGDVDKSHWAFKLLDVEPDLYNRDVEIEDINAAQKLF